jgi:hypothetical protein
VNAATPAPFPTIARLPGRALVTVTLGDGTQRSGQVLVDSGTTLFVEYLTPAGHFAARQFDRNRVVWL